jgi:hypothetical protein
MYLHGRLQKNEMCSIGVYVLHKKLCFGYTLNNITSITRAEIEAIIIQIKEPAIFTDSLNSCLIIDKSKSESRIDNTIQEILKIGSILKATIIWIPSHINIKGNDIADGTAKKAYILCHKRLKKRISRVV